jgi:hypothetical protein
VRPILVPVSPWSRRMCVPWNRAGARQRDIYCKPYSLNPERLAPPLLPHLTGHVTGQVTGQRAVTGHVTGHVRRDRFHALTPTRNKPSFTPRRSGGRGEGASHMTAERCACARARGPRRGTYRETLLQTLLNG